MHFQRRNWIRWIPVILGAAAMLTPALLELGWVPEYQASKAIIFILGFIVLEGGLRELREPAAAPELVHSTEDFVRAVTAFSRNAEREVLIIEDALGPMSHPMAEAYVRYPDAVTRRVRENKLLHAYVIIVARPDEVSEEAFQWILGLERDASLEGRVHFRYLEAPVSFHLSVFDQRHWVISFAPNPNDPRGAALIFRDHEEGARRVADFVRHRWLEAPGVTISLTEAYDKWKARQLSPPKAAGA
jgi:hypothetical protein